MFVCAQEIGRDAIHMRNRSTSSGQPAGV